MDQIVLESEPKILMPGAGAQTLSSGSEPCFHLFVGIKFLAVNELSFTDTEEDLSLLHSGFFFQLMEFSFKKDEKLLKISRSIPNNEKYSCPEIQTDVIEARASLVGKSIFPKLHSSDTGLFTLSCDATRDTPGVEHSC